MLAIMDVVIYVLPVLDLIMECVMDVSLQLIFITCIASLSIIAIKEPPFSYSILPLIILLSLVVLVSLAVDAYCRLFQAQILVK